MKKIMNIRTESSQFCLLYVFDRSDNDMILIKCMRVLQMNQIDDV